MRVHPEALYKYFYGINGDRRRADIIISCKGDNPLVHIELKRKQDCVGSDGQRIREILITRQNRPCRDLKGAVFGAFVFHRTGQRQENLEHMVNKIYEEFKDGLGTDELKSKWDWSHLGGIDIKKDGKITHWTCAALAISVTRAPVD
jgi:hypothetical protein